MFSPNSPPGQVRQWCGSGGGHTEVTPYVHMLGAVAVSQGRQAWQEDTPQYEGAFDAIGQIASQARECIIQGRVQEIGPLMNQNQARLEDIGVSSPELGILIDAARSSGASGAKLSGAGLGGNMIAIVDPDDADRVENALREAGAVRTLRTEVST